MHASSGLRLKRAGVGRSTETLQFFCTSAIGCNGNGHPPTTTRRLATVVASLFNASLPGLAVFRDQMSFSPAGNAVYVLGDIVVSAGHAIAPALVYVESPHAIVGFSGTRHIDSLPA